MWSNSALQSMSENAFPKIDAYGVIVSYTFVILCYTCTAMYMYNCGGVTRFLGSLKISLCEERRLGDTQNLK